jgi:hypothetical protein
MRAALLTSAILGAAISAGAATAVDMNDPRRATGREDDVRIDAVVTQETVSSGAPIAVTYQVQNLTAMPVAVATKVAEASYDAETMTITVGIGSEIPADGKMPVMIIVAPGEKKTFTASATALIPASASVSRAMPAPRYVQVKVTVLRDVAAFATVVANHVLSDEQFDRWMSANATIFLNALPVRYEPRRKSAIDVESRAAM